MILLSIACQGFTIRTEALGGHGLRGGCRVGVSVTIISYSHSFPSLLSPSKTTNNLIGEVVGLKVELAATGEMDQAAELAIDGRVKTADKQIIGIFGRDARQVGGGAHGG
jgi:hypothetical protein